MKDGFFFANMNSFITQSMPCKYASMFLQEAWWLRRACHRSRCRILAECAEAFKIPVSTIRDIHAHESESVRLAIPTIDTVEYDVSMSLDGETVKVFDACTDIGNIKNGFLASMHPSEGFWIFKGIHDRSRGSNAYGVAWHTDPSMPVGIPSSVIKVPMSTVSKTPEKANERARKLTYATALTKDSNAIVRVNIVPNILHHVHGSEASTEVEPACEREQLYQFFDEAYLQQIAKLGWHRDMGIVELIPIVVGLGVI